MSTTVRRATLAAILIVFVYPLSYAPVYRLWVGTDTRRMVSRPASALDEIVYWPVTHILIDRTPLRRPLLAWSDLWGVRVHHAVQSGDRIGYR